jgi:hypothetical protein
MCLARFKVSVPAACWIFLVLSFSLLLSPSLSFSLLLSPSLSHSGAGPGQSRANAISELVTHLGGGGQPRSKAPGNERADVLAGRAAESISWSAVTSLVHLKLRISEKFRSAREGWHRDPAHHGAEEIPHHSSQEVMPGPRKEHAGQDSSPDPYRALAIGRVPQADEPR